MVMERNQISKRLLAVLLSQHSFTSSHDASVSRQLSAHKQTTSHLPVPTSFADLRENVQASYPGDTDSDKHFYTRHPEWGTTSYISKQPLYSLSILDIQSIAYEGFHI